ncbi:MAG: cytochrome P460 family protein [Myxococcota bacterium]
MNAIRKRMRIGATGLMVLGVMAVAASSSWAAKGPKNAFTINSKGELVRPTNYRTWVFVGTPLTPNELNNGKAAFPEFHNVYIDPVSYDYWKQNGTWRDGTVLVKELVSVGTKNATSGNGYFQGEYIGLEAEIKSKKHFGEEPGNWAYFSFTDQETGVLKDTASAFPTAACNSCHEGNAQSDFVFTQYYPVLRAAKGAKTAPENAAKRTKP